MSLPGVVDWKMAPKAPFATLARLIVVRLRAATVNSRYLSVPSSPANQTRASTGTSFSLATR